ncbi:histamine H2 receptor-like [Oculina patagonica]
MNETSPKINGSSWVIPFIFTWFGLTSVTIAIFNAGICVLFWTQRRLRSTSNLFFVNLAIADILVGFVAVPWKTLYFVVSPQPLWLPPAVTVVDYVVCMSFLGICALTYDRYQAILHPLTYPRKMASKNTWKVLLLIWSLPGLNFLRLIWMLSTRIPTKRFDSAFGVFLFSVMLLATGGIVFAYVRIFRAAKVQEKHARKSNLYAKRNQQAKFTKAIRSCLGVTICFACCWLPRGTFLIARICQSKTSFEYDLVTFGLMSLSAVLNPIIYSICNRDVKRTLEMLWNRWLRKTRLKSETNRGCRANSMRTYATASSRETGIEMSNYLDI